MIMSRRLIIRSDASKIIGAGHVMRCLALARAWLTQGGALDALRYQVMFASAEITEGLKQRIAEEGYCFHVINAARGSHEDADLTRDLASDWGADVVVLDGYCFKLTYQSALRSEPFTLVLYDDQSKEEAFDCDVLVNQNISALAEYYISRAPNCTLLMGSEYASLRPEFLELRKYSREYSKAGKVLVSLGLSDTTETLKHVLMGLDRVSDDQLQIDVLVGTGNLSELDELFPQVWRHQIKFMATVTNFAEKLFKSDMAVLAAGGTMSEAACIATPVIIVCIADNQEPAYREFVRRGAALDGGMAEDITPESFSAVAARMLGSAELRADSAARARMAVDGRGALRMVNALKVSAYIRIKDS